LGWSGRLLALGGLAGIVAVFLPLVSFSVEMMGLVRASETAKVVDDWRGKVCLGGYLVAILLTFILYPPDGLRQKALCWVGVSVGLVVVGLAIWLLSRALDSNRSNEIIGLVSAKTTIGIGAVLNVGAGAIVLGGGCLKAREAKLL
jgi:hypothetical protein